MIFANHAHVMPKEQRPSGTVDNLLRLMDECGIDKAVAFAPFADRFHEVGLKGSPNDWLAKEILPHSDRLVAFGTVDFTQNLSDEVDRIASLGFKGIKLHPPYQDFVVNGSEAYEVYKKAEEYGLFVSFHSGMHWNRLSKSSLLMYDDVAWDFPKMRFSMEHIGGYHFFKEALAVMCNHSKDETDHVFAGWTSISDRDGMTEWTLTDEQLETVIFQTGENRSIFGLDFPYKKSDIIKYDIERINRLNISEECKRKILGETLENLLK